MPDYDYVTLFEVLLCVPSDSLLEFLCYQRHCDKLK